MNIFERAVRAKLRFRPAAGGLLSVEDLFDLPLTSRMSSRAISLDSLALALHAKLEAGGTKVSFVDNTATPEDSEDKLAFDVVLHVIEAKKAARDASEKAAATKAAKARIMEIIEKKQDGELESKSIEELRQLLAAG